MPLKLAKPLVITIDGFYICELFVQDENGNYIACGFGVFNPKGELIASFSTLASAEDYINEATPPLTSNSLIFKSFSNE